MHQHAGQASITLFCSNFPFNFYGYKIQFLNLNTINYRPIWISSLFLIQYINFWGQLFFTQYNVFEMPPNSCLHQLLIFLLLCSKYSSVGCATLSTCLLKDIWVVLKTGCLKKILYPTNFQLFSYSHLVMWKEETKANLKGNGKNSSCQLCGWGRMVSIYQLHLWHLTLI